MEGAGCVLEECQRLTFGWGYSEMFKSVCVCVCHIDIWTSMSAVLAGVQDGDIQRTLDVELGTARGSDLGEGILRLFQVGLK